MASMQNLSAVFWSLLEPWQFLVSTIQNAWFSAFWAWAGANIREGSGPRITALLEGRVSKGRVVEVPVVPPVDGVVLEIGPGVGFWVDLFAKFKTPDARDGATFRGDSTKGLKVYGVEPNTESHAGLNERISKAGLEGTYTILPTGIQSLSSPGAKTDDGKTLRIEKESVDCIVSFLCLCSIPDPEENISELYQYLKKGGRWYIYEHVQVKGFWPMRLYQAIVNIFWPHIIGGCQLCRDTEKTLRQAGPWEAIDIEQPPEEPWHQTIPHIIGTLTK